MKFYSIFKSQERKELSIGILKAFVEVEIIINFKVFVLERVNISYVENFLT